MIIFILSSVAINCLFTPWIRIFPDKANIGMGHRNQTQIEYSTIFFKPTKFSDGWSPQAPGGKSTYGVYLGYDYKTMALHEMLLAGILFTGYLFFTVKKKD